MNGEGYRDPTADKAIAHADNEPMPSHVREVIRAIRMIAGLAGFDIEGRIVLKDRVTGRVYK